MGLTGVETKIRGGSVRNRHVDEDIAMESVGVEGTVGGEKIDVIRTPLVQVPENAACGVCHNNLSSLQRGCWHTRTCNGEGAAIAPP